MDYQIRENLLTGIINADTIAVGNYYDLSVYFLLAGYPEKFNVLVVHEESFGSIFHYEFIDCLSDDDVTEFFTDTFNQAGIDISHEALDIMVMFSSGLHLMMKHNQFSNNLYYIYFWFKSFEKQLAD